MARRTIIDDTRMIEHRWRKGAAGYMADVAILAGCHMGWIGLGALAGGINTVVTGITPFTHHLGAVVVNKGIEEIGRVMAHGTIPACILMNGCIWCCAGTVNPNVHKIAVVAGDTITGDTHVSKIRGSECIDVVTIVTILARRYMLRRLNQVCRQEFTHMTAFAAAGDTLMDRSKERCRGKDSR